MAQPKALPKLPKEKQKTIAARYDKALRGLERIGFELDNKTTSQRIMSCRYLTSNAKGYISIRYSKADDVSFVLCEFYGKTKTEADGIGAAIHLLDITPRINNVTYYKGLDMARCQADVLKYTELLTTATGIFKLFANF